MKAAIFDLDGTLLDSMSVWQKQLTLFLQAKGVTPPENLINMTKTLGTYQAIAKVIEWFQLDIAPQKAFEQFENEMAYHYAHTLELKPFVREYLAQLHKNQIPMVIATATNHHLVDFVLKRFQLEAYFQFILTVADVGIGKESPLLFQTCANRLGFPPKDCTVFEDSLTAIKTAEAAGFAVIAVDELTAVLEKADILRTSARYITSFQELLEN